ncbi:metal ABC transporter solute-binding protein, Zn/Mn family [Afifella sp. IM 167]|uniref:metal ABC transporter solute-binding protein, Zn/Mn family n=1 Tax=Afifella sp. IM 167 TaxID=2033586 RepID=UPI001CCEEA3F|nr:zinc ABC transporter substrate-binding protein [Afifella sp. IM 167]MBZ8134270.1 manganese transporter [Afifella sp. IM 167]
MPSNLRRLAAALAGAALGGLLSGAAAQADEKPRAITTVGMIADVAQNVAAECVASEALMGPGVDPHLYQASAGDVHAFDRADIILYSGYALEGQLGDVLERFARRKPTVAVSEQAIDPSELIGAPGGHGIDPHLWMDASLWARLAPTIAEAFLEVAPDCSAAMQANAAAYQAQLAALHDWVKTSIATIPERQRILVTAHDAFAYYGRAYGIEVTGIQGISTEAEASVADIRNVAQLVVDRKVPAIFVESTINPRTVQAIVDAARQKGQEVQIGGQLYSDAMGEPGTAGGTYLGMIFENTRTIVEALGGEPAPLPGALKPWADKWNVDVAQR